MEGTFHGYKGDSTDLREREREGWWVSDIKEGGAGVGWGVWILGACEGWPAMELSICRS